MIGFVRVLRIPWKAGTGVRVIWMRVAVCLLNIAGRSVVVRTLFYRRPLVSRLIVMPVSLIIVSVHYIITEENVGLYAAPSVQYYVRTLFLLGLVGLLLYRLNRKVISIETQLSYRNFALVASLKSSICTKTSEAICNVP